MSVLGLSLSFTYTPVRLLKYTSFHLSQRLASPCISNATRTMYIAMYITILKDTLPTYCLCQSKAKANLVYVKRTGLTNPGCPYADFRTALWNMTCLVTPRHSVRTQWNKAMVHQHCKDTGHTLFICPASITIMINNQQLCYAPSHLPSSSRVSVLVCSLLWSSSLVQSITPCFIISAYSFISLFLIPFPHMFHVSIFVLFHVPCPNPHSEPQTPNPKPHSILLHITSPCSIFVPMLFCPNPCPFPSTLLCSFNTYTFITSCKFPSLKST